MWMFLEVCVWMDERKKMDSCKSHGDIFIAQSVTQMLNTDA